MCILVYLLSWLVAGHKVGGCSLKPWEIPTSSISHSTEDTNYRGWEWGMATDGKRKEMNIDKKIYRAGLKNRWYGM